MSEAALVSIVVVAGAFTGGLVNGLTGFGTALTALPLWVSVLAPTLASPLAIVCSIVGQLQTLPAIWHAIDWRRVAPFVAGGVFGVPVGTMILPAISVAAFKIGVGALLVVACGVLLFLPPRPPWNEGGRAADAGVGLAAGVLGGLAALSGILPTIWAELRGWEKDARRAVFQGFNLSILTLSLLSQGAAGLLTAELGRLLLVALPGTILGAWIGRRIYSRLDTRGFARVVLAVLMVAGLVLVVTGLRGASWW